jgi:tetratricopeptide (TPR) repeat protein
VPEIDHAEAALREGRAADALAAARGVLAGEPRHLRALLVAANAAIALGQLDTAVDMLEQLRVLQPRQIAFPRTLAGVLNKRGRERLSRDAEAARADFRQAVTLQPSHGQAWFNLAHVAQAAGDADEARIAIARHLALAPQDTEALLLQATLADAAPAQAFLDTLRPDRATQLPTGALALLAARRDRPALAVATLARLTPRDDVGAATEALNKLARAGEDDAVRQSADRVIACRRAAGRPSFRAELVSALALPAVPLDAAELGAARARFTAGLARLEADWTPARLAHEKPPLRELAHCNFLLAYQGENDLALQTRYADLLQRAAAAICPSLAERPAPPRNARPRIGLLSSHWRQCTVGSYFGGWIGWLAHAGFEVRLYQLGPQQDAYTAELAGRASSFRLLTDGPLEGIAQQLRDEALDLLIYPELGMDARLLPLAALRLARRQAVAWGHPVTSGFATIDEFLSCAEMEPADGALDYRERLRGLPGLGVDYRQHALPARVAPAALGLDPARSRVLVPQSLFKLHPDGDEVMAAIAAARPRVQFVCFEPERPAWLERYRKRLWPVFAAYGATLEDHLLVLPLAPRDRYLQVNLACDLMLDSLHWSGGNTALDALCSGLPVVTCPGRFMRGRQSHAMLQRLGVADALSTATPAAQAERVLQLLQSDEERHALSGAIGSGLPALFEFEAARKAFVAWVRESIEG